MRNLKYRLATKKIVNTLAEAKASNQPYEEIFEDIITEEPHLTPKQLAKRIKI